MFNKIGTFVYNLTTFGTDCAVCIGWRILLGVVIAFILGVFSGLAW
jgi:hypothetical protein